jgi:hypothetical protein
MKRAWRQISSDVPVDAMWNFETPYRGKDWLASATMSFLVPDAVVRGGDVICILFRPRLDYASDSFAFSGPDLRAIAEKLVKVADAAETADG